MESSPQRNQTVLGGSAASGTRPVCRGQFTAIDLYHGVLAVQNQTRKLFTPPFQSKTMTDRATLPWVMSSNASFISSNGR